jgi:MscS family membrane protein
VDSYSILVVFWYDPPYYRSYLDHTSRVNTRIVERFDTQGINFDLPTQSLHLAGDDKRPLDVGQLVVFKENAL